MGLGRGCLCLLFPPLAVLDRGCGTLLVVSALTLAGWVPRGYRGAGGKYGQEFLMGCGKSLAKKRCVKSVYRSRMQHPALDSVVACPTDAPGGSNGGQWGIWLIILS